MRKWLVISVISVLKIHMRAQIHPAHLDWMSTTAVKAWRVVRDHYDIIRQSVNTAIGRGLVHQQDREDATHQCEITAYELAQRGDVENYEHLLRRTLKRNLFRDGTRPGTDAMDRSRQFLNVKDPDSADNDQSVAEVEEEFTAEEPLEADDIEGVKARIKHLIDTRVLPRLQKLA
jgi:hypothetical protein